MRTLSELLADAGQRSNLPAGTRRNMLAISGVLAAAPLTMALSTADAQQKQKQKQGAQGADAQAKDKNRKQREKREDIKVLNYALTLEHLEYAFYRDGLAAIAQGDFPTDRDDELYIRLQAIRDHEDTHVDALTATILDLGGNPVEEAPCYNFDFSSATTFLQTAALLENTGVSAYDGAIRMINAGNLVQTGATIATVEARHASYLNYINDTNPFPDAFDSPLTMEEVLDAAAPFFNCTP